MARRSEHSQEEIKQMVLEATEDIVREYGYSALKVRKIAADIGYTVGSIYMVFANMNDLNMHIKARTWQKMTLYMDSRADQPVSLASVNDFASNYLDFSVSNEGLWRMLFEHQLPLGAAVPAWYLHDSYSVVELFYQLLKQLNMQHSDEQLRQAAETLIQGMQGICMQLIMQGPSSKNTEVGRKNMALLVDYFIRGWSSEAKK